MSYGFTLIKPYKFHLKREVGLQKPKKNSPAYVISKKISKKVEEPCNQRTILIEYIFIDWSIKYKAETCQGRPLSTQYFNGLIKAISFCVNNTGS